MPDNEAGYYMRTYTLKVKDGVYAWIYDDGTERFPGVTFDNPECAHRYVDTKMYKTEVKFKNL